MIGDQMRADSTIGRAPSTATEPVAIALEDFAAATDRAAGINLRALTSLDSVEVDTRNSTYRITVVNALESRVLVSGGAFFPTPSLATISGASLGGSMLKRGVILNGFQFEILTGRDRIVTTRVREIRVNPPGATPGPF
jgi:hypothetical protein